MVEVFKTDVRNQIQANLVIDLIHRTFPDYIASFDLEDCDNILRVVSLHTKIQSSFLISLLTNFGFSAEILPDDPPMVDRTLIYELNGISS